MINITINGNEKSKEEIIYNNLTKEEQLSYLKSKSDILEYELMFQKNTSLIMLCSFIGILIGIIFMMFDYYLIGIIAILLIALLGVIRVSFMYKALHDKSISIKYDKAEYIRKMLNKKFK